MNARYRLARRTLAAMSTLAFSLAAAGHAHAATLVVTSNADTAGGTCGATCTLRQALTVANASAAADTINFAIPSPIKGTITIAPASALPTITQPVTINGYSQGGTAANTVAEGASDARIRIRLSGAAAGNVNGLAVCAPNTTIRGMSVTGYAAAIVVGSTAAGALCGAPPSNVTIAGNFLGLQPNGLAAGNSRGVSVTAGSSVFVGGTAAADRNVVSANTVAGISFTNAGATRRVDNNLVGTDPTGVLDRGNGGAGIFISTNVADQEIGTQARNRIAFNESGIATLPGAGSGNRLGRNHFFSNDQLGIDLGENGVTPNDANDPDTGPNGLQNFPVLTAAARTQTGLSVNGSLDLATGVTATFELAFYASTACDPSGNGEGERFLGVASRSLTNGAGEAFSVALSTTDALPPGTQITATATSPGGSTSEFSECFPLDPPPLVVTSEADPGDGTCDASCTLRDALLAVNTRAATTFSSIHFAIPGPGPHTITPATALPSIERPTLLDGYTEPGASRNTLASGSDAVILIRVDGVNAGASSVGIGICADDTTVTGLSITRFGQSGILAGGRTNNTLCPGRARTRVVGNFVGVAPDGSAAGNDIGVTLSAVTDGVVGDVDPASRNVLSANADNGIRVVNGAPGRSIDNNHVGTDPSGLVDRGNGGNGIELGVGAGSLGVGERAPNRVSFNRRGIGVASTASSGLRFPANHIAGNAELGIDLGENGVTANDADDADTSPPNAGQNFPVIGSAQRSAAGIRIDGTLDVPADTNAQVFQIAVYANDACDASGNGEGARYLGRVNAVLSGAAEGFTFDLPTDDPLPQPTQVTTTATSPDGNTSEFSACVAATDPPPGLVVRSIADTDGASCDAGCTLRQAINVANAQAGPDAISFDIDGTPPFTIEPLAALPMITDSVTIDGYTQIGSSPNTLAQGSDAVILIEIADLTPIFTLPGPVVCAPDVTIRGIALEGASAALRTTNSCGQQPTGFRVAGSFFGLRADGTSIAAVSSGVRLENAPGAIIGGTAPADRNVFGGIGGTGVHVADGSDGVQILGNMFGLDPTGTLTRANIVGVQVTGGGAVIGGDGLGEPNRFANHGNAAIVVSSSATSPVTAYGNEFSATQLTPIDLGTNNVTPNDADDADTGPNGLQNFPVLTGTSPDANGFRVQGTLDVPAATADASYRIALYENVACDASGNGEGEIFLGSRVAVLGGAAESFDLAFDVPAAAPDRVLTATATAPDGRTSELSACFTVQRLDALFGDGFE